MRPYILFFWTAKVISCSLIEDGTGHRSRVISGTYNTMFIVRQFPRLTCAHIGLNTGSSGTRRQVIQLRTDKSALSYCESRSHRTLPIYLIIAVYYDVGNAK